MLEVAKITGGKKQAIKRCLGIQYVSSNREVSRK